MSNILGNMPPVFGSGYRGVVPAPSAADVSAQNILRADGTWGAGPSGTLPSQTGNGGKLLTTDGTNASWSSTLAGNLTVSGTGTNNFSGSVLIAKALTTDFGSLNVSNDLGSAATVLQAGVSGSGRGGTYFGQSEANSSIIFSTGTSSNGLLIGSFNAKQVVIGTNNTAAISISGTTQATTLSGNLTVSGTGGISIGSATFTGGRALTATTGSGNNVALRLLQTSVADWEIKNVATTGALSFAQSATEYARLTATGNLLLGTTTDSGNGKLQLADHTTSAGGIGFGTTTSLYRYGITTLGLQQNNGSYKPLFFYADVTNCGVFDTPAAEPNYSGIYFNSTANTATIATKGTIALTLDNAQNAIFAGKTYNIAGTAIAPSISFNADNDSGFYNPGGNQVSLACGGGQIWNTTVNGLSMASGKDIYLGNAYVAGAPTATGYVTIKDSAGNIYKVLVGT